MAQDMKPSSAGAKVTVACKMPNGLLLRVFAMETHSEPVMGGGVREAKSARQIGGTVKLNGNAVPFGKRPDHPIVAGYALTHGIDKEFFDKWLEQNRDSDIVKNSLVFAYDKGDSVRDAAKEHAKARSGLEPIEPDTDPRLPKGNRNLSGPQTAERQAA